jgi:hypothetical protein
MAKLQNEKANRALRNYFIPLVNGFACNINRPAIQANNFKIKLSIIQLIQQTVQFEGLSQEDHNVYIVIFSRDM